MFPCWKIGSLLKIVSALVDNRIRSISKDGAIGIMLVFVLQRGSLEKKDAGAGLAGVDADSI